MSPHPRPVTGLAAGGRIGAIDVTWEHAPWEPLVDHYAVHAATTRDVATTPDTLIGTTVYGRITHDTLGPEAQTRYYRVVTVDASGRRSSPSAVVGATSTESLVVAGEPIATVGEFDSKSLELALAPSRGQSRFRDAFPDGVDFTYGSSDPAADWCYLHPGPEDGWGGEREHTFRLRFDLEEAPGSGLGVVIWLIDTHASRPGTARLAVNDAPAGEIAFRRGATRGSLEGDATVPGTALVPSFVEPVLDAALFRAGQNTLDITKSDGSWHAYDAVGVFRPS
ncbi:polysaccharide lyase family protein [Nocardiopsis sediminis]|uniref:Polysaccharide lyase family protein n=1 Tax=Nocardiopsis sediminis TaxID=1778267 RepID=A0ABV8FM20_9ACTN